MARKISVEIVGDAASLERSFKRAKDSASGFNTTLGHLRVGFGELIKGTLIVDATQKALEALHETVALGVEEFKDHARAQSQTVAALKSTGGAANVSAKQIEDLGLALSNLSGVNDEVVQGGENVLLAFQNIRNFAGKGNQIFTAATRASLDFSVRSGRSVQAAAVAVGRALQDPAKAAGSLRRAYVVLTKDEKTAIATAVRHGDVLKAQRLIVADLEKRYGGAAKAAGQTLAGQLSVLKERFADLAGEGIGLVAPALTRGVVAITDFVKRLSEASSGRAKLRIVFSGIEGLGRDLVGQLKTQIDAIDFRGFGERVQQKLQAIDWRVLAGRVGRTIGDALASALNSLAGALNSVDWNNVGRQIVRGVGLAIGAVAVFLKNVNWVNVAKALVNSLSAALRAAAGLLAGVGEGIGAAIIRGIEAGLNAAKNSVIKIADEIVLKIIAPFKLLGKIGADPFSGLRKSLQTDLAAMASDAVTGGQTIGTNLGQNVVQAAIDTINKQGIAKTVPMEGTLLGKQLFNPDKLPPPPDTGPPASTRTGITAAQRNTFFDNAIARILLRGGLGTISQQISALHKANDLIAARLKVTKDVTRRMNLEDDVLQNQAKIADLQSQATTDALQKAADAVQKRQDAFSELIAGLQLKVTKAQATAGFGNDLAALSALQDGIKKEIKEFGKTADLEGQLFDVQQQIKQTRQAKVAASEFFTLGLGATGGERVPFKENLRKRLGSLSEAVKGTVLDTKATSKQFDAIRKVLARALVPPEVRTQIKQMLDDIQQQLKDHVNRFLPTLARANQSALLKGLGLDAEQIKALRSRLSQVGVDGLVPRQSLASVGLNGTTVVHTTVRLDNDVLGRAVTKQQQRSKSRNPDQRRGLLPGGF